jgi:hypothetical protein
MRALGCASAIAAAQQRRISDLGTDIVLLNGISTTASDCNGFVRGTLGVAINGIDGDNQRRGIVRQNGTIQNHGVLFSRAWWVRPQNLLFHASFPGY